MDHATFIYRVVVVTLSLIIVAMISAMIIGLFDPVVDNKEIFAIIGPAFQTVIGCFVGILGGRAIERKAAEKRED